METRPGSPLGCRRGLCPLILLLVAALVPICAHADAVSSLRAHTPSGKATVAPTARPAVVGVPGMPNVVLVMFDDARPDFAAYGPPLAAITPTLNSFFADARSAFFSRAFTNFPECGPSRTSILLGRSPFVTGVLNDRPIDFRSTKPGNAAWKSLFQVFKSRGYLTLTGGKIYHPGIDDSQSYATHYAGNLKDYGAQGDSCTSDPSSIPLTGITSFVGCMTTSYKYLPDFVTVNAAIASLENYALNTSESPTTPFFLAMGLYKPHAPLHVHEAFVNLYRVGKSSSYVEQDLLSNLIQPQQSLYKTYYYTWPEYFEPTALYNPATTTTNRSFRVTARLAYLAALSQSDFFLGMLTKKLQALNLFNNTLFVFTSDHGIFLSEHHLWGKQTNYDTATHVPLLFHVPWLQPPALALAGTKQSAVRIDSVWEQLNLYRTIVGLAGLSSLVQSDVQGVDLSQTIVSAIETGQQTLNSTSVAYSQVLRCSLASTATSFCQDSGLITDVIAMGFSIRTVDWRYSVFMASNGTFTDWSLPPLSQELYAHSLDPIPALRDEGVNVASNFTTVSSALFKQLKGRFAKGG